MTTQSKTVSNARLTWAGAFSILSLVTLPFGLLDPLEGFPLLVAGVVFLILARNLSKVPARKLVVSSLILSALMMAVILGMAFVAQDPRAYSLQGPTVDNWIALSTLVLLWTQRLVVVLLIIGLVLYAARIFRSRKPAAAKPAAKKSAATKSAATKTAKKS
jgi:hypothetical protein